MQLDKSELITLIEALTILINADNFLIENEFEKAFVLRKKLRKELQEQYPLREGANA